MEGQNSKCLLPPVLMFYWNSPELSCEKTNNVQGFTQIRLYNYRRWLRELNFGFKKMRNCTIGVAKTKALISFAVTGKLICAFVFTSADCWFYHDFLMTWLICVCYYDTFGSHFRLTLWLHSRNTCWYLTAWRCHLSLSKYM